MITLTLLHPLQEIAVQSWTFKNKSSIRIGRASDNEIVLYSAVVSRHHVKIEKDTQHWRIVSLGANGTYIDGEKITDAPLTDGMTFRLASSGPKILVKIESESGQLEAEAAARKKALKERLRKSSKDTLIN